MVRHTSELGAVKLVEVALWCWTLAEAESSGEAAAMLSAAERERAQRFRDDEVRRAYIEGKIRMRRALGAYVGVAPEALQFEVGPHGKPGLAGRSDVHFSFSRSGKNGALAVCRGHAVGVDIEAVADIDYGEVARGYLHPLEQERLAADPRPLQCFYELWTLKEAVLKAMGTGLGEAMAEMAVSPSPAVLLVPPHGCIPGEAWALRLLHPGEGIVCALAIPGVLQVDLRRMD